MPVSLFFENAGCALLNSALFWFSLKSVDMVRQGASKLRVWLRC